MHLVGQLSNPPNESTIAILGVLPPRKVISSPTRTLQPRRLGNGVVRRAAARALADGQPMKLLDIHAFIEDSLGRPVSYASVEWCMRMGIRGQRRWAVRLKPGWYRLR